MNLIGSRLELLRRGEGWLQAHPERELIVSRYLRYQRRLASEALARLVGEEEPDPDAEQEQKAEQEAAIEKPLLLNEIRLNKVAEVLKEAGSTRVIDLGCGEGRLIRELLKQALRGWQTEAARLGQCSRVAGEVTAPESHGAQLLRQPRASRVGL